MVDLQSVTISDYRLRTSGLASETLMLVWDVIKSDGIFESLLVTVSLERMVRGLSCQNESAVVGDGFVLSKTGRSQVVHALRRLEGSRLKRWWTPLGVTDLTLTCSFSVDPVPWFINAEIKMRQGNHYGKKVRIRQHCSCKGGQHEAPLDWAFKPSTGMRGQKVNRWPIMLCTFMYLLFFK